MELKIKKFCELSTKELYEILRSRAEIFVVEQKMNCRDLDGDDFDALHCYFEQDEKVVAYLRAQKLENNEVKIGRVLTLTHGVGMGTHLLNKTFDELKRRFCVNKVVVHAQLRSKGFYDKLGFVATSEEFIEENVAHVKMEREI